MGVLDDIRTEIVARRDAAMRTVEREQRTVDCMVAELEAHDRVVALFDQQSEPQRAECRDIAAFVLNALTDEWQTVAQLAKATGCAPSRILPALYRLGFVAQEQSGTGKWRLHPDGAP